MKFLNTPNLIDTLSKKTETLFFLLSLLTLIKLPYFRTFFTDFNVWLFSLLFWLAANVVVDVCRIHLRRKVFGRHRPRRRFDHRLHRRSYVEGIQGNIFDFGKRFKVFVAVIVFHFLDPKWFFKNCFSWA